VVLLALMVLALIIAGISKGCGDDEPTGSLTTTGPTTNTTETGTSTASTGTGPGDGVIDQITQVVQQAGGVQFETGSVDLTSASRATLDQVAAILAQNPTVNVEVGAHTDSQGDEAKNRQLSEQRAAAVVTYLSTTKGIQASRLSAVGYGEAEPLVPNEASEADRNRNRRVEFKLKS